jgi:SAM-dependent methyltransferase
MRIVPVLALAACAHAPAPSAPSTPAPPPVVAATVAPAPAPSPAPAPPSEAEIAARSHAVLEAFDRGDLAAFAPALAPGFLHFEGGSPSTREAELAALAKRKPDGPHIGARTWKEEHTFVHSDDAVFFGLASEHMAGNEVHGGYDYEGWYTLAWRRDGSAWQLALWTWQRAGAAAERDTWNEMFRNSIGFNKQPNRLLVDTARTIKRPGRALDVAMGQGRNALYLAAQGWKVTGVDFSDEGLRQARAEAVKRKLALDTVNADLSTYDFGIAKWDLVTMIYAGDDIAWIERIKPSLKKGGVFVVEYFHDNDTAGQADGSFAKGELAALFADGFEIVKDEIVDGVPDWAMDRASIVRFVARKR